MSESDGEAPPTPGDTFDGEAPRETVGESHADAEGMEPGESRAPWWERAARSTSPNPPLSEVGGFDDLQENATRYLARGLQKASGIDDAEAWVDMTKGILGLGLRRADAEGEEPPESDAPEGDELIRVQEGLDDESL